MGPVHIQPDRPPCHPHAVGIYKIIALCHEAVYISVLKRVNYSTRTVCIDSNNYLRHQSRSFCKGLHPPMSMYFSASEFHTRFTPNVMQ